MRRTGNAVVSILFSALTLASFGQVNQMTNCLSPSDILERQVGESQSQNLTTTHAFSSILSTARVPGGIITILNCEEEEIEHPRAPFKSSLRDALDSIVLADPQYQWQVEDGVVNFIPTSGEPALLQTRIIKFDVENVSADEAINRLQALPEVQKRWEELHFSPGLQFGGLQSLRPRRFSVHCQDITLREALNAVVRAHGRAVWAYTEWHCHEKKVLRINILVG